MTQIKESGTLTKEGSRWLIQAISPGNGSSGTYPQEVLEAAAKDRVFPAGTMMMVDHATEAQDWERPEGSIKDLAGVLTEDARWDDQHGALVAEAKIFEHWRPVLESMREEIGVSIRASGEVEESAEGRVVKRLVEGRSIDFVTRAGRGGRVLEVLESERPSTLDEIAEIFRPNTPASAPAGEEPSKESESKEAATMADTKNPEAPSRSNASNSGDSELERLRKENAELKAEIARLKAQKAKEARRAEVANIVEEAFDGVDPGMVKDLLIDRLAESDTTGDDLIKEARTFAEDYKTKTAGTGAVRGLGESRPVNTDTNVTENELPSYDELTALKGA